MATHRAPANSNLVVVLALGLVVAAGIGVAIVLTTTGSRSRPDGAAGSSGPASTVSTLLEPMPDGPSLAPQAPTLTVGPAPTSADQSTTLRTAATGESPTASQSVVASTRAASRTPATYVRYTVKPGDNLTLIAEWFHQQNYQPVYQWNQTVIGQDPSLIHPGQVLIVAVRT